MVKIDSFIDRLLSVNDTVNPSLTNCIREDEIEEVIGQCKELLAAQPIVAELDAPVKVCGDIHGQFIDLLRIFNRCGWPPETTYLFLGDYVDRGRQQLEVICLLMAYKIKYPDNFFILRGNHECASINRVYGFYDECKRRYTLRLYNIFQDVFDMLPLCALISSRIFCMHGGLSPMLTSWEQLKRIQRPLDPPNKSIAMDLLWSDPEPDMSGWGKNSRGVSYIFGADIVAKFCEDMDVDLVARGHQVVQDGFEFFADRRLVTIFSAPRYCGEFDNNAAVMLVNGDLMCSFEIIKSITKTVKVRARNKSPFRRG